MGIVVADVVTGWTSPMAIKVSTVKCLQTLGKLLTLGRIQPAFLEDCLLDLEVPRSPEQQKPLEPIQIEQLDKMEDG